MSILALTAAAAAAPAGENPYGLLQALEQGGIIAWSVFIILVGHVDLLLLHPVHEADAAAEDHQPGPQGPRQLLELAEPARGRTKLEARSAYRAIVDDALVAQEQHDKLTDPIDRHDWMANSLARSQGAIGARLGEGLAFLATVGSTAPFIGLFGTVIGIYRALIKIGASGQASIDVVAGPVGEALIMTALGLVVAVPAVLAYNWLVRRNKSIMEDLAAFTNDLHGYLMSEGRVKPRMGGAPKADAGHRRDRPRRARTQEPLRTGATPTAPTTADRV